MGFKCGIIGLPNVGKSTLFNALTKTNVPVGNFPFCTINPNIGVVNVPDVRLNRLAKIVNTKEVKAATIEFVDVAGLVSGASKGVGLGNKFLENIRMLDTICHVVRCFENKDIVYALEHFSPVKGIEIINLELIIFDIGVCEKAIQANTKKCKHSDNKKINDQSRVLKKILLNLHDGYMISSMNLSKKELSIINPFNFLTLKKSMYIANVDENNFTNNVYLTSVYKYASENNKTVVPVCAKIETEVTALNNKKYVDFLFNSDIKVGALNNIICMGYQLLSLRTYFTVKNQKVYAWTISVGGTAYEAARKVHSDFAKGFVCVYVISYNDFIRYNGKHGAKSAGKLRFESKNYEVQEGDILHFQFIV